MSEIRELTTDSRLDVSLMIRMIIWMRQNVARHKEYLNDQIYQLLPIIVDVETLEAGNAELGARA